MQTLLGTDGEVLEIQKTRIWEKSTKSEQAKLDDFNLNSYSFACHKVRDDTAITTSGCIYQFGIYPSAACSPSYIKCGYGVPQEHPCDVGTVYDDRIHACNWPDQVGIQSNPLNDSPDNGSTRLLVQYLLDKTDQPLSEFDCIELSFRSI